MSKYSSKWLKVSEPVPHVLLIELNRFWRAYGNLFETIVEDGYDVRAAVVSSTFPKFFTAGLDSNAIHAAVNDAGVLGSDGADTSRDGARSSLAMRKTLLEFQEAIGKPEQAPFPVIAAIHGWCIGLGVDLTSICDIRYAASNTTFSIKEVDIGLAADIGTLAYLPKITGNQSLIRELAYTARNFSAAEAEKIGLVSKVVEGGKDEVVREALKLAEYIASKSPVAVSGTKHLITHARDHSVPENLAYTGAWNAAALMTDDILENLKATKTKKKANFKSLKVDSGLAKL
ncbi:enoyl-CoA hydratase/isomerase [Coprinopsis cinerea okayama7|uniref:Enoyl-CoA hydratase/isomerase n=1 Tax=Coprinopsis cinerea (strain Okayama-7 / 130 / ATCC MYA-4618 / FGSC 9003) TaxID=240176 RepID=A8NLE6_COPC7|nr:enoyl-CoA hydratase/isomerase [Coprinopsis cinerea okayama7\|eukprot:XP_001834666.1 enoyl-CoA hydratase/isomerase [Coprinopsis cinerea okayama7\